MIRTIINFIGAFIGIFSQEAKLSFVGGGQYYKVQTDILGSHESWWKEPPAVESSNFRVLETRWFTGAWRRFTCPHEMGFVENIHGDQINHMGGRRSVWRCKHCTTLKYGNRPFLTKPIFMVDAETDGLMGQVWAIGAVVVDGAGEIIAKFAGQLDPTVVTNSWVIENVVPHVQDLPRFESREGLFNAFWKFWAQWKQHATAWADTGHPVESGLFRACAEFDKSREFGGPYPLHETRTYMLAMGVDPDNTEGLVFSEIDPATVTRHNPVDDSIISAKCVRILAAKAYWLQEKD